MEYLFAKKQMPIPNENCLNKDDAEMCETKCYWEPEPGQFWGKCFEGQQWSGKLYIRLNIMS